MIKADINKEIQAENLPDKMVYNNKHQTHQMLRDKRKELKKKYGPNETETTYGDPTPHNIHEVKTLLTDWKYAKSQNSNRTTSPNKERRDYNAPFTFKVGNKNISNRLDELDKNYRMRRFEELNKVTKVEKDLAKKLRYGRMNDFSTKMYDLIKNKYIDESEYYKRGWSNTGGKWEKEDMYNANNTTYGKFYTGHQPETNILGSAKRSDREQSHNRSPRQDIYNEYDQVVAPNRINDDNVSVQSIDRQNQINKKRMIEEYLGFNGGEKRRYN